MITKHSLIRQPSTAAATTIDRAAENCENLITALMTHSTLLSIKDQKPEDITIYSTILCALYHPAEA